MGHRLSTAVLVRVEPDGTKVYRKNSKEYRVGGYPKPFTLEEAKAKAEEIFQKTGAIVAIEKPAPPWPGFYPPGGRRQMYKDKRDPRTTRWFAEAVRERRQQTGVMSQAVKPGPQHL
jgi:hypothetical protein